MTLDAYAALAQARANEVDSFTTTDGLDVQAYAEHLRQRDRDMQEEVSGPRWSEEQQSAVMTAIGVDPKWVGLDSVELIGGLQTGRLFVNYTQGVGIDVEVLTDDQKAVAQEAWDLASRRAHEQDCD